MAGARLSVLTLFAVGAGMLVLGTAAQARSRQATRERQLSLAWRAMGRSLHEAADRLDLDAARAPDEWDVSRASSDPLVRSRLDSLEARIWREMGHRSRDTRLDSLREGLRRDRERVALALAHCRQGKHTTPSRWFLAGFPDR